MSPIRSRLSASFAGVVSILALTSGAPPTAQPREDVCAITTTERVVAVGDIHGAYDQFVSILRAAGLVDRGDRWAGGKAVFIQTGDVLDRGAQSRKVIDLLRRLEREAPRDGGRVLAVLGNHEFMRLAGDWRYVSSGELRAFGDSQPEMFRAFSSDGDYGRWLRQRPAAVKVNAVLYVHGGVSQKNAALGCEGLNTAVGRDLQALPVPAEEVPRLFASTDDGPLWYRGMAAEPERIFAATVENILAAIPARAVVIGHTPVATRRITPRFGGRVILIDTGMLGGEFYRGGVASALEIQGDTVTAVYERNREAVAVPALESRLSTRP